jgi:hypothetical protein
MTWHSLTSRVLGGLARWLDRWAGFLRRQAQFWASVAERSREAAAETEQAPREPGEPPAHWLARIREAGRSLDWIEYRAPSTPQRSARRRTERTPPAGIRRAPASPSTSTEGERPPDLMPDATRSIDPEAPGSAREQPPGIGAPRRPSARAPTPGHARSERPAAEGAPKRLIPRPGAAETSGRASSASESPTPMEGSPPVTPAGEAAAFEPGAPGREAARLEEQESGRWRDAPNPPVRPAAAQRGTQPDAWASAVRIRPWHRAARTQPKGSDTEREVESGEVWREEPQAPSLGRSVEDRQPPISPERTTRGHTADPGERDASGSAGAASSGFAFGREGVPRTGLPPVPPSPTLDVHRVTPAPEPDRDEDRPHDRWPDLPREAFPAEEPEDALTAEAWEARRRAWQRRQRLDEEQKGNPWSASLF